MPIDVTDICRSILEISRPLRFPMDIVLAELLAPIHDAARATVKYLQDISSKSRFARDLVMWLTEECR